MGQQLDRRTFLAELAAAGTALRSVHGPSIRAETPIGIQIGAVSFLDEGTERVLDILQERAHVNTLFVATFTTARLIFPLDFETLSNQACGHWPGQA